MWATLRKAGVAGVVKTERVVLVTGMPSPESRRNKFTTTKETVQLYEVIVHVYVK